MNRLEYYDGLKKYEMLHSGVKDKEWEDHKYIDKIDLGNGQFRYVYDDGSAKAQAAREAAQRNQYQRQQQNLKTAQNTAKKMEAERQQASKTSSQIYSEKRDRVDKTNQEIQNLFNAGGSNVYDKVENIIKETPEYKSALSFLKNRFDQCQSTVELRNTVFDGETEDYAKSWSYTYNSVPSWFGKLISGDLTYDAYQDKYQELKRKERAAETINSREEEIKKSVEIFRENDKNPTARQYRLDKAMDDYLDDFIDPNILYVHDLNKEDKQNQINQSFYEGKKYAGWGNIEEAQAKTDYEDMKTKISMMRWNEEKDPENDLPIKASPMSIEDDMKYINYGRATGFDSLSGGGNCRLCTLAMDLRQRGYDVSAPDANQAKKGDETYHNPVYQAIVRIGDWRILSISNPSNGLKKMYTDYHDAEEYHYNGPDEIEQIKSDLSKSPNTYGNLDVEWAGYDGGHSMFYKVDNDGYVTVYDGQTNVKHELDEILSVTDRSIVFTRTDNLTPNYEYLKSHGWIDYH